MDRRELIEWIAMLALIVLWWPVVFAGWTPAYYYWPLAVVSAIVVLAIFRNRYRRMQEGFEVSERMMQQKRQMEQQVRGGKPDLDEEQPPDVSGALPLQAQGSSAESPEDSEDQQGQAAEAAADKLPFAGPPAGRQQPDTGQEEHSEVTDENTGADKESD